MGCGINIKKTSGTVFLSLAMAVLGSAMAQSQTAAVDSSSSSSSSTSSSSTVVSPPLRTADP
ncbi:MAG TPA: hypothetical protein VJ723_04250, partial [Candidatus Angelobacter sp.]|nr:hypothetical protein [Candidatus Angelobacter sp.]